MIVPFIENINFYELLKFIKLNESSEFNKDYIPVEYLQSDGNQYIITPFYYDQSGPNYLLYNIKCKACINDNYSIFGRHQLFNLTGTSGKLRFYGYQESQRVTTDIDIGTTLNKWELRDKNLYCNDIIQNETPDYFDILSGAGVGGYIYLFCRMYGDKPDDNGGICKISNFYVSAKDPDTGTITEICDLVACIRKSDNKPGMYDKVSQTFLTNQGTGEFKTPIYGYLSGNPPFTFNSNGNPLADYTISGNTVQSGAPTPENPVIPQGCGDLEISGAKAGQYKISISSANTTTPVYMGEVETMRNIKKYEFTGQENITRYTITTGNLFRIELPTLRIQEQFARTGICTHYRSVILSTDRVNGTISGGDAGAVQGFVDIVDDYATVEDFKAYLATQYAAGTPVTVWYVLAEPETGIVNEPLMKIGDYADTVSKEQAGVVIPTINGSNTLTVDTTLQPSEVSIVYKK